MWNVFHFDAYGIPFLAALCCSEGDKKVSLVLSDEAFHGEPYKKNVTTVEEALQHIERYVCSPLNSVESKKLQRHLRSAISQNPPE